MVAEGNRAELSFLGRRTLRYICCAFLNSKTYGLGVADKAASLMGCESPTANCPIRAVSISDVWRGNELYDARK
jgi:hypothetical protein